MRPVGEELDLDTVTEFLETDADGGKTYGEITANYLLTTDPDGSVSRDYMEAAGQSGIPTAFIVGKTGEIEWIGHPMQMDGPLAEELGVTEEQKKRLRERYTEIQAETDEAIRKIRREAREKLLKELTGSQREKLADLLGDDFDYQPNDMRAEMRRMRDEARRRRAEEAEKKD